MFLRNRISLEQRERIVRAFEDVHEDYLAIAETIGVNRSTARGIVSRYVREGRIAERPRGGANHVRVDDAMRDCLDDIINENCLLTIAEMNRELRLRLPHKPVIHDRTVARALEGMLYRVKLARPLPADRNRPDVPQKRVEYGNLVHGSCSRKSHCIYRRVWLQYLDRTKSRTSFKRREGLSLSMWSARKKCDYGIGNFTH